jgi:ATP-dependent Lon protease
VSGREDRARGIQVSHLRVSHLPPTSVFPSRPFAADRIGSAQVTGTNLSDYLGVSKHRYGEVEPNDRIGIVSGLARTEVGGELLTVEGVMIPGKGKMTITGNLRDVMKESISAAASYV